MCKNWETEEELLPSGHQAPLTQTQFHKHLTRTHYYCKTFIISSSVLLTSVHTRYDPFGTSLLFILLFIKSQYTVFAHLICFAIFILLHILLIISLFLPIYCSCVVLLLYNFYFYSFALSTERTWLIYISLLILPCIFIMWRNKQTLNLEHYEWLWTL